MSVIALNGVNCPACGEPVFFVDNRADYDAHMKEHPEAPLSLHPGVDVGSWTSPRELEIGGKMLRVTRRDLLAHKVFPIPCPGCSVVYVARLDIVNTEAVMRYEKLVRPYHPPSLDFPVVEPKWGFVGQPVVDFVRDVRETRNPVVRASVVRKLLAAGWDFQGLRGLESEMPSGFGGQ